LLWNWSETVRQRPGMDEREIEMGANTQFMSMAVAV
jgi:hypothetical protein